MLEKFLIPDAPGNANTLRVIGFGACMMAGTPHRRELSFFRLACTDVHELSGIAIDGGVVSLGGFPTHKAAHHVQRALKDHPQLVVIQLGSTDLTVSLTGYIQKIFGLIKQSKSGVGKEQKSLDETGHSNQRGLPLQAYRSTTARKIVDIFKLMLCRVLRVRPIHGDESVYLPAMASILQAVRASGAQTLLLAPFPHGDPVSDFWAAKYTRLLEKLAQEAGAIFADTYHGLKHVPFEELLLSDKLHLSIDGHRRVAKIIREALLGSDWWRARKSL